MPLVSSAGARRPTRVKTQRRRPVVPRTGGPKAFAAAAEVAMFITDRGRFSARSLVLDTTVAGLAFACSVWAIGGVGYEAIALEIPAVSLRDHGGPRPSDRGTGA
jgi:hypothetical protein